MVVAAKKNYRVSVCEHLSELNNGVKLPKLPKLLATKSSQCQFFFQYKSSRAIPENWPPLLHHFTHNSSTGVGSDSADYQRHMSV